MQGLPFYLPFLKLSRSITIYHLWRRTPADRLHVLIAIQQRPFPYSFSHKEA
jgi:hypothetical protein